MHRHSFHATDKTAIGYRMYRIINEYYLGQFYIAPASTVLFSNENRSALYEKEMHYTLQR